MIITWQMLADPQVMRNLRDMDGAVSDGVKLAARQNLSASDKQKLAAVENPRYWTMRDTEIADAGWSHPVGAPQTLNTPADYQAWLSYDLRQKIERGNATDHGWNPNVVFFNLHQSMPRKPAKWLSIARAAGRPKLAELQSGKSKPIPGTHSLKQANEYYAAQAATKMPLESIDKIARKLTMQESWFAAGDSNEAHRRGLVAAYMSAVATNIGQSIPYLTANVSATVAGAGSIASAFWNDAKDWVNNKVVKPLAAIVHDAARYILSLRETSGLLKFVLDAAGISIMFSALEQTSAALEAGDWAAFDDEAFLIVAGQTLVASGTVMAIIGAVFPPLAIIAAAISAASISLGQSILAAQSSRQQVDELRIVGSQIEQGQKLAAANLAEKQKQAQAVKAAALAELQAVKNKTSQPAKKRGLLVGAALAATAAITVIIVGVAKNG